MTNWKCIATAKESSASATRPMATCQPSVGRFGFNQAVRDLREIPEFVEPVQDPETGRFGFRVVNSGMRVCLPKGTGMCVNSRAMCNAMGIAKNDGLQLFDVELEDDVYVLQKVTICA